MTKPIIYDGEIRREMTGDEYAAWQELVDEISEQNAALKTVQDTKTQAVEKLRLLGLTDNDLLSLGLVQNEQPHPIN